MNKLSRLASGQISLFILSMLPNLAISKDATQELVTLHAQVGPVIDVQLNDRYHLFSRNIGIIAAKVYRSRKEWWLHLLGKKDGRPWLIIRKLMTLQKTRLTTRLISVAQKEELGQDPQFSQPVLSVSLPEEFYSDQPLTLRLTDHTKLFGRITNCAADTIEFVTISDIKMNIPEEKILDIKWPQGKLLNGEFRRYDPNHIRLFFGPTGRTLRRGEVNFADFYVFFPTIGVGVTDFLMIGGGVSIFPGANEQLFYVSPKLRLLHQDNLDLAVGMLYMGVPNEAGLGTAYAAITYGNPLRGVTLGLALPFEPKDLGLNYAFLFGGEVQVSNSAKLMTENWLFLGDHSDSFLLISGGIRFIGESLTVGLGLATSPELVNESDRGFPFIPWLDFSVSFGN